jgi:hypothetical protein
MILSDWLFYPAITILMIVVAKIGLRERKSKKREEAADEPDKTATTRSRDSYFRYR